LVIRPRASAALTDGIDRQRRGSDHAKGGIGQRQNAFGMQIAVEQVGQEAVHVLKAKGLVRFHRLLRASCRKRGDSMIDGFE
jgi:hypothetical protein